MLRLSESRSAYRRYGSILNRGKTAWGGRRQALERSKPTHTLLWLLSVAVGIGLSAGATGAEETAKPSSTPLPKVTKVTGSIKLHETVAVKCDGLKEWAQTSPNDPSKLVLYLNGTQMKGLA